MRRTRLVFFGILILLQAGQAQVDSTLQQKLDAIALQDVPPGGPGIVTGIVQRGQVIYRQFRGLADLGDSSRIGPDTRFNIASNGKQFTALAVLLLVHQGRLSLDADIRQVLPGSLPKITQRITVKQLLTHRSGIRDVYDLLGIQGITWWRQSLDNRQVDSILRQQQDLNQAPGTVYQYSNSNYLLLADIVAKVSGKSFRAFTDSMFRALGMPSTAFEDDHDAIRGPIARPYFNFGTWRGYDWVWDAVGDGNLFSSLRDMLHWESIVQQPAIASFPTAVIAESQLLPEGITAYGYGLEFGTYKGSPYRFHEGATGAWKATLLRFPGQALSIITATNSGKTIPSMQTRQMADLFLPPLPASPRSTPTPGPYIDMETLEGVYQNADGFYFRFERRKDDLVLIRDGRNDVRLVRLAGNIFCQANDSAFQQAFEMKPDGSVSVTAYHWSHDPYTLVKPAIAEWNTPAALIEGSYRNAETGVTLQIREVRGRTAQAILGADTASVVFARPNRLLGGGYQLDWTRPANGRPLPEIFLQMNRVRNLRFTRLPASHNRIP